jgi:hypothetical protein
MNAIQGASSLVPYMGCAGNHEHALNFSAYKARFGAFEALAERSGSGNMLWYSFDDDLVHFVTIDTEIYHYCSGTATLCKAQIQEQIDWLTADLAAVDRSVTPWVVAVGHKQGWQDSLGAANFTVLEAIMQDAHVDLYVLGHQHNYNRLLPQQHNVVEDGCYNADYSLYQDCTKMVSIVTGSPGCREKISKGSAPQGNAVLTLSYGFGHLQVVNSTHLHWTWEELGQRDPETGSFKAREGATNDDLWIVQTKNAGLGAARRY